MAPDPSGEKRDRNKVREGISRWRLKARQNERECDVSVVSSLFMALLVTAVAFAAAVKFRRLWFRAVVREKSPGEKETELGRYIQREIFRGEAAVENRREDRARERERGNKRKNIIGSGYARGSVGGRKEERSIS